MSEWVGKVITCDRCGREVRLEFLKRTEFDGGFTHANSFEEMPKTWKWRSEIGYLCPICNADYESLAENFMKRVGTDDDWTTRACIETGR